MGNPGRAFRKQSARIHIKRGVASYYDALERRWIAPEEAPKHRGPLLVWCSPCAQNGRHHACDGRAGHDREGRPWECVCFHNDHYVVGRKAA